LTAAAGIDPWPATPAVSWALICALRPARLYRKIVEQLADEFGAVDTVALRELMGLRYT
jgi:hypothetical protein